MKKTAASSYREETNGKSSEWHIRKYPSFWMCSNITSKVSIPGNFSGLLGNMRENLSNLIFKQAVF
jgi:hypothetical protein